MKRDKSKNRILSLLTATSVLISVLLCGCDNTGTPSSVPEVSVTVSDSSQSGTPPMTSDTYSDEENSSHTPPPETTTPPATPSDTTTSPITTTPQTTPPDTTTSATIPPDTTTTATTPPETTTTTKKPETTLPPKPVTPDEPYIITPTADGKTVYQNDYALIDASNSSKGYIMVKLKEAMDGNFKITVTAVDSGASKYTFSLKNNGSYDVIPLTEGSGTYKVSILKQTSANKGAVVYKEEFSVSISDEFSVFLTPTQFCTYDRNSECVKLASTLTAGMSELEKIEAIYEYVTDNIKYVSTAENAANGYIPYPDRTLSSKSGICFDYASLMAAMLRSQKLPTKVVVGYAGDIYHAWISVYVKGSGWIDGIISFDGYKWNRMDPTFAASARDDADYRNLIDYISNNKNYNAIYQY